MCVMKIRRFVFVACLTSLAVWSCKKEDDSKLLDFNLNLYPVSKDKQLGEQMDSIIRSDPNEYPILDPVRYDSVYAYIQSMFQGILQSDEILRADQFDWERNNFV